METLFPGSSCWSWLILEGTDWSGGLLMGFGGSWWILEVTNGSGKVLKDLCLFLPPGSLRTLQNLSGAAESFKTNQDLTQPTRISKTYPDESGFFRTPRNLSGLTKISHVQHWSVRTLSDPLLPSRIQKDPPGSVSTLQDQSALSRISQDQQDLPENASSHKNTPGPVCRNIN